MVVKKNAVHIYNNILFSYEEKWNYEFFRKIDGIGKCYMVLSNPGSERQTVSVLLHMCFLAISS